MQSRRPLDRLAALGASNASCAPVRRRIALSNQVALVVAVIAVLGGGSSLGPGDGAVLAAFAALAACALAVPGLNALGLTTASRLAMVLGPPFALLGPGLATGRVDTGYLLALPYALLAMSLLPLVLFHASEERAAWRVGVVFLGLVLLGHEWLLLPSLPDDARRLVEGSLGDVKPAQMIAWALAVASSLFLQGDAAEGGPAAQNR